MVAVLPWHSCLLRPSAAPGSCPAASALGLQGLVQRWNPRREIVCDIESFFEVLQSKMSSTYWSRRLEVIFFYSPCGLDLPPGCSCCMMIALNFLPFSAIDFACGIGELWT